MKPSVHMNTFKCGNYTRVSVFNSRGSCINCISDCLSYSIFGTHKNPLINTSMTNLICCMSGSHSLLTYMCVILNVWRRSLVMAQVFPSMVRDESELFFTLEETCSSPFKSPRASIKASFLTIHRHLTSPTISYISPLHSPML